MATTAQGRTNIAPSKIPWELIQILIAETYGGKVDDENDFTQLSSLIKTILTPLAFEPDHKLVQPEAREDSQNDDGLTVPDGNDMNDFLEWVQKLPEREPPTYLGLPANAEKLLLVAHGKQTIENLIRITDLLEESEQLHDETGT